MDSRVGLVVVVVNVAIRAYSLSCPVNDVWT